jgi:hypothetical protein
MPLFHVKQAHRGTLSDADGLSHEAPATDEVHDERVGVPGGVVIRLPPGPLKLGRRLPARNGQRNDASECFCRATDERTGVGFSLLSS